MTGNSLFIFRFFSICLLLVSLGGCATNGQVAGEQAGGERTFTITGSTRFNGEPLSMGEITALRAEPGGMAYTVPVEEDGSYHFNLPAGPYFLMGHSLDQASQTRLFSFWTNNPVQLYGDIPVSIVLPFVTATAAPRVSSEQGIRGKILLEDKPVMGAVAAVYLDTTGAFHGLPYAQSLPADQSGEFSINVEPGKYFIIARSRNTGGDFQGPLLKGDLSGFYPHNPVILREGEGLTLDVPMVRVRRPRGTGSLVPGESIIVSGKITSVTGEAVPGIRVVLYSIPEMLGRPVFISSPTDETGSYAMEVSRNGTFYAAARSVIGRPPETGELMGFYDGSEDHSLVLQWGDRLKGIDIIVKEVW